ncbi:AAA family ATPase [Sphingomonas sp. SAFR-052]|uniref:AAA family ATPase n=1 Tax=Sphingomonas sp. SAFR-052 TaxID=3436867 RepID=UPI003F803B35
MANSKQLIGMIRSHAAGDDERFFAIAEHIATDAEKAGHGRMAGDIRTLVDSLRAEADAQPTSRPVPIASPRGELAGLMRASYPEVRLSDLVLATDLERRLRRIVREHAHRDALAEKGLSPSRKLLLAGPPGTGKTMTAAALAGELGLPLFTIMLDGVINKFMGESAAKLRLVFDSMRTARGVYLFDEVDALATRRGSENDVGEARRVLNSLLQFLDEDETASVVVAATNHRALLDQAIFRRFDAALPYSRPTPEQARAIVEARLALFELQNVNWDTVLVAADGLSQADLVAAAGDAARDAVLEGDNAVDTGRLLGAMHDRSALHAD